ncbi:MAG: hypothetical protein Q8P88_00300 [Candidatus Jorgensenbacteria bacterium]|nr:hypothetical protein [Candidatus Jorgensenbacteria bacterium]
MKKELPGAACAKGLLHWKQSVAEGIYENPTKGSLRLVEEGVEQCVIPLPLVVDVNPVETVNDSSPPMVEVKILIDPRRPWVVRAGKDAKGKPVFLHSFDSFDD